MDPIDAFWHIAGFLAPAVFTGSLAASLAKLLWRDGLAAVGWWRLCRWASAVCVAALVGGLLVFKRDGSMATYALMVCGCALTLWGLGFRQRRH